MTGRCSYYCTGESRLPWRTLFSSSNNTCIYFIPIAIGYHHALRVIHESIVHTRSGHTNTFLRLCEIWWNNPESQQDSHVPLCILVVQFFFFWSPPWFHFRLCAALEGYDSLVLDFLSAWRVDIAAFSSCCCPSWLQPFIFTNDHWSSPAVDRVIFLFTFTHVKAGGRPNEYLVIISLSNALRRIAAQLMYLNDLPS